MNKIVIIGNSASGISAAETVRQADSNAKITIASNEESNSYLADKLFDYIAQNLTFEQIAFKNADFYTTNNIELLLNNPVTTVDLEKKRINFSAGQRISFDNLVIASGKSFFVPKDLKGHRKENVLKLNSLKDADLIREHIAISKHTCVWGADSLAVRLALLAKEKGADVNLISANKSLMPAWLDKFSSQALEEILISRGIGVILDRNVSEILGNGEVNAVKIDSGKVFAADLVLVTENLRPNVDFLKESNLTIEQGITVDKRLKTNIDAVSAAGDVVQFKNQDWLKDAQGYGWDECLKQGKTLASNILGQDAKYEASRSIYDFSYRDLNISSWGELNSLTADEQLYHRLPNQAFKLFNLKENKIIGFVLINDVQERDKFLELAKNQTDISSMKFETNREPQKERITNG